MYKQPPSQLVDLALYASLMRTGAVEGGGGTLLLEHAVVADLSARSGWPIGMSGYAELSGFVAKILPGFDANTPRYTIDTALGQWMHAAQPETLAFLEDPSRLQELSQALNTARSQIAENYGDPLENAPKSGFLRVSFDAIKNSKIETKVEKLNAVTSEITRRLGKHKNAPVAREFWVRTFDELAKKDWPFQADPEATLPNEMMRLVGTSPATVADIKARMYDMATNFVVNHAEDLRAAAGTVLDQMDAEVKSGAGINLVRSASRIPRSMN